MNYEIMSIYRCYNRHRTANLRYAGEEWRFRDKQPFLTYGIVEIEKVGLNPHKTTMGLMQHVFVAISR